MSYTIERDRKAYYDQLERHQNTHDVIPWLVWFAETEVKAQRATLARVGVFVAKARFFEIQRDRLNDRQAEVVERMFRPDPEGFKGGLSAANYLSITGTSRVTAARELQDLVELDATGTSDVTPAPGLPRATPGVMHQW
ncbi:MAG: hypothetical protein KGH84_05685 [Paracoccaceae bacterium]|nr:hypothetical protein [Paracoccaceae bacterium]